MGYIMSGELINLVERSSGSARRGSERLGY